LTRKGRARLRKLVRLVRTSPELTDPEAAIREGRIVVNGRVVTNPGSLVREDASIVVRAEAPSILRGERKLNFALDAFGIDVRGRVALDLGAAAGGFTRVLLARGTARVHAVDTGYGQLLGSLRQDPRVANLERTNLVALSHELVPERVDMVTADLSYVALAEAIPQPNGRVRLAAGADLIALVKPQFELGLAQPPGEPDRLAAATRRAREGIMRAGWNVLESRESPVRGSRGSVEFLVHARRA
jgi:23S rRNA (cytidine1920-2'-O)/16S rRNA (cytidine1409-2'-O)-methyltransferase